MPRLTLNLLGAPEILLDGQPVKRLYAHAAGLLVYLAVEGGHVHSRDALIDLLWPEDPLELGRQNLRQAISRLRNAIGDRHNTVPFLIPGRGSLELNRAAEIWCDTHAFDAACRDSRLDVSPALTAQAIGRLSHAVQLYRGEFLAGFGIPNSASFNDWLATQRERCHRQVIATLERKCAHYEQTGQRDAALAAARRLVEIEPAEEKGHRLLMRLLAESGQPLAALAQFRACEHYLDENLGVAPSRETLALLERLQRAPDGQAPEPAPAQRRRLTVLHAGLTVASDADPEDLLQWCELLRRECAELASRLDASARSHDGLDVVLYFGYPQASADDAQRAARAALQLQAWARQALPRGARLSIGLAGGPVVRDAERGMIGPACLNAARLRHLAQPGVTLLGGESWPLLRQEFRAQAASSATRAGRAACYRLLGTRDARLQPAAPAVPPVGRDHELQMVTRCWAAAREGSGRMLVAEGVPGIGKSCLLRSARERVLADGGKVLQLRCLPANAATALEPFLHLLREVCGISGDEPPARRRRRFAMTARRFGFDDGERNLLASMLDLATAPGESASLPPGARQRTMGLLLRLLRAAATEPVLLCIEDIHWLDPSSGELLHQLVDEIERLPMLILATSNGGEDIPWLSGQAVTSFELQPLDDATARALIRSVAGELPELTVAQIIHKAGGIPLFLQELAKAVRENSADDQELEQVPASLQESLLARLDRLQEAGRIARLAAVIGREFDTVSLESLLAGEAQALSPLLARLIEAHIIEPADERGSTYAFCHGIIHELAYETLLRGERRELHARLAGQLLKRVEAGEPIAPETLAHHLHAAEQLLPAAHQYYLAGLRAFGRNAFSECITLLREALAVLSPLPACAERDRLELRVRVAMGFPMLLSNAGQGLTPDNFAHAEALLERVDDPRLQTAALRSLCAYHVARGAYRQAERLVPSFLDRAARSDDVLAAADARVMYGLTLTLQGKPRQGQNLIRQGLALSADTSHAHAARYGSDPWAIGLSSLGLCALMRGRLDEAADLAERALARTRWLEHPLSFVWTGNMALCVLQILGEDERALALADEVLGLCRERGIDSWARWALMVRHRLLARGGGESLPAALETVDQLLGADPEALHPYPEVLALECCLAHGDAAEGLRRATRLEQALERAGAQLFLPELLRLRGQLRLLRDPIDTGAAGELRAAFNLAARQRNPTFQLRAALALASLDDATRSTEGTLLLRRCLGAFRGETRGAELQRARALAAESAVMRQCT